MMNTFNILLESFWTASVVPFANDATLYAMKAFGTHDMALPVAVAAVGAVAGQAFNWWLGTLLRKLSHRAPKPVLSEEKYEKAAHIFNRYIFFLLFFSFLPLFKFLVLAAGFLGTRLRTALPLILAGYALHYGLLLG